MTDDYSNLIRSISKAQTPKPDWLKQHSVVFSPTYGRGVVKVLLGNFATILFDHQPEAFDIDDCLEAVSAGTLLPPQSNPALSTSRDIEAIPYAPYQMLAQEWETQLRHLNVAPPRDGQYVSIPETLAAPLKTALAAKGINRLFSHQVTAYNALRDGEDLVLSTDTNSGKTLAFSLPILEGALTYGHTTLMIVPSNQLMDDQFEKMATLMELTGDDSLVCGKIHGGIEQEHRLSMFNDQPQVVLINPDCLNGLIRRARDPKYAKYTEFLSRLKYIVIDEGHEEVGVMGAHLAGMLMRLRLSLSQVGGDPWSLQYIVCSATVSNQAELANTLTQRNHPMERPPVRVIDDAQNGAPSPGRVTLIFNHQSNSASTVARLVEKLLIDTDLVGIVFFNSRNGSKKLMETVGRGLKRLGQSGLLNTVKLFNSSVSNDLKRHVIQGIKDGGVRLVFSTSSLQAGVDMPELDCSIVWGFPKLSDLRQRWGRAGRGQVPGLCIFVPSNNTNLDYYYVRHPQALINGQVEAALLDPHYPIRLAQHLLSAAAESGLKSEEVSLFFGEAGEVIAGELLRQGKLLQSQNLAYMYAKGRPYYDIPVRGNRPNSIKLINTTNGEVLETLAFNSAMREVFPGAIYKVQDGTGKLNQFRSQGLRPETNAVKLDPIQGVNRFTQAIEESDLTVARKIAQKVLNLGAFGALTLRLDWSKVDSRVVGSQEWEAIQVLSCETNGCKKCAVDLTSSRVSRCEGCRQSLKLKLVKQDLLAEVLFEPEAIIGYSIECPTMTLTASEPLKAHLRQWVKQHNRGVKLQHGGKLPLHEQVLGETDPIALGLHSFLHALIIALPLGDRYSTQDIEDSLQTKGPGMDVESVLMDTVDAGTGATEYMFEHIQTVARNALQLSQECDCQNVGCPRCLTHTSCLDDNEALYKPLGVALLKAFLETEQTETLVTVPDKVKPEAEAQGTAEAQTASLEAV
ncbi:DEAD/DEAH box helicase [Phormidium sp. FACHB-592]|uniref:DEAD/DEAH box helicase n=1 Tax=Stenomitos frigidus AS-A4 TaxID=2933935 RepID=A0ABV0KQ59_9CYAN|nr:DEAD/DEAH box helicase [Phormidium sp. FACHB-592]MBD2075412.1 DEAD/DEAH box helicase [Phormidium sp. FACHB-592]